MEAEVLGHPKAKRSVNLQQRLSEPWLIPLRSIIPLSVERFERNMTFRVALIVRTQGPIRNGANTPKTRHR